LIEVASWPADLSKWNPQVQPFYLEFFGETEPVLDETYAEVVPASQPGATEGTDAPVYEYWWTLGHPGAAEHRSHWYELTTEATPAWESLADPAARIYLYFPIAAGWRVKEILATVKYLMPTAEQHNWLQQAGKDLEAIQPAMGATSQLAGLIPGGATASKWMETISKLQISSVPQTGDFRWSVSKVTFGYKQGVMQGVVWTLPKSVFELLGGRITGSLALSFIPAAPQVGNSHDIADSDALAHAVVYGSDGTKYWVPDEPPNGHGFVYLKLKPKRASRTGLSGKRTTSPATHTRRPASN